jgi:hypothetical protein
MNPEQAKALRVPFPPEVIGQLPRIFCKACSEANKQGGGTCGQHNKSRCATCKNNITSAHLHLSYVGHAEVTDRFLQVDTDWTWEPLASDADGLPKFDASGGLWIKLTIGGVTRLGYGDAAGKRGSDAVKETIGDALRNAGLRFGVAIDLWGATFKGTDNAESDTGETHGRDSEGTWESAQPAAAPAKPTREQIVERGHQAIKVATDAGTLTALRDRVNTFKALGEITPEDAVAMLAAIDGREAEFAGNTTPALVGASA